jgi:hypothetical protein
VILLSNKPINNVTPITSLFNRLETRPHRGLTTSTQKNQKEQQTAEKFADSQKKKKNYKQTHTTSPSCLPQSLIHKTRPDTTNCRTSYKSKSASKFHKEAKTKFSLVLGNLPFPTILVLTSQRTFLKSAPLS